MLSRTISILLSFLSRQQFRTNNLVFAFLAWSTLSFVFGLQDPTQVSLAAQQFADLPIRIVDEADEPIADVRFFPLDTKFVEVRRVMSLRTDSEGRAVLMGFPYTDGICKIGAIKTGYAIHQSELKILPNGETPEQKIVLKRGKTIKGRVLHKDGIAPENSIYALPTWCPPTITPLIQRGVQRDGTFELENIVEGEYRVYVPVPVSEASYRPLLVLDSAKLSELAEPLDLKVDYPSRSSMTYISGKIRWLGNPLDQHIVLEARASKGSESGSDFDFRYLLKPNATSFTFGPLPAGKYDISVKGPRIENLHLRGIEGLRDLNGIDAPPEKPITVRLRALPQPQVAGTVVDPSSGKPIEDFHIQYYVDQEWMQWDDLHRKLGIFSFNLPKHGKCKLSVWAEGFAVASFEPFDTIEFAEHKFEVKLQRGAKLNGVISDAAGKPVDGADVQVFSFSGGVAPRESDAFALREGYRKTIDGRFEFKNLPIGVETLRVSHPDFGTKTVTAEIRESDTATVEVKLERITGNNRH